MHITHDAYRSFRLSCTISVSVTGSESLETGTAAVHDFLSADCAISRGVQRSFRTRRVMARDSSRRAVRFTASIAENQRGELDRMRSGTKLSDAVGTSSAGCECGASEEKPWWLAVFSWVSWVSVSIEGNATRGVPVQAARRNERKRFAQAGSAGVRETRDAENVEKREKSRAPQKRYGRAGRAVSSSRRMP